MLNDYQENARGYRIFEAAVDMTLSKPALPELKGLDKSFFDEVDKIVSPIQFSVQPLICSFSREPDVLSQWRAYADGGSGVAVGFSEGYAEGFTLIAFKRRIRSTATSQRYD
jgi:hypothetical protein